MAIIYNGDYHAALSYLFTPNLGGSSDQQKRERFRGLIVIHDSDEGLEAKGFRTAAQGEEVEIRAVYKPLQNYGGTLPDIRVVVTVEDGIVTRMSAPDEVTSLP